ncbi:MAG TPA: hypothetical protein VKO18_02955 [Terriglobia bacterium]|nr:hypothetical protein [Terriglobia bacterium]
MRRIKWITLGVPLAVCLSGLFAGPALPQQCSTLDGKPNCDTYNISFGNPCKVQADCIDMGFEPCGAQRVYASVSISQGATCEAGDGFNGECGSTCGGYVWAADVYKGKVVFENESYCCSGCV